MIKILLVTFLTSLMVGCSTTLRCGSDGQSSYVEIINVPSYYEIKNYSELCNATQKNVSPVIPAKLQT